MTNRWRAPLGILSTGLLTGLAMTLFAGCQRAPTAAVSAELFDAEVRVLPSGSAEIRETFTLRFDKNAPTFEREIEAVRADALTFVSSSIDGVSVQRDAPGDTRVNVTDGATLRVRWTLPASATLTHTFELRYVVVNAVAVEGTRGKVWMPILAAERSWLVDRARLSLLLTDGAVLYSGSGIAEADWQVERVANGIVAERASLSRTDTATVVGELSVDPSVVKEPRWQVNERWGQLLMPAFLSGAGFILVVGAGILWIIKFQYPRQTSGPGPDGIERQTVRNGLQNGGLVTIAAAVVSAVIAWFTLRHLGPWPMAIPVSVAIVGLVFLVVSRRWV